MKDSKLYNLSNIDNLNDSLYIPISGSNSPLQFTYLGDIRQYIYNSSEYVTESELSAKGYLTEHQDISHLATSADLTSHTSNTTIHITADERTAWNEAKSNIDAFLDENAVSDNVINTLKEIQEYITYDGEAAEQMISNISANATAIATLENEVINDEKVTASALNDLNNRLSLIDMSSKQDVISDLYEIRSGAALGATALQSVPDEYVTETELNNTITELQSQLTAALERITTLETEIQNTLSV